jgi:hypothetical protein
MKKIGHCCVTRKVAESRKQNLEEAISWSISDNRSSKKSNKTEDNLIRLCYKTSNYKTPNYKTPKIQNIELQNADYKTSKVTKGRITKRRITKRRKLQKVKKLKVESNKILQKAEKDRKLGYSILYRKNPLGLG